jgi:hypothetical protein
VEEAGAVARRNLTLQLDQETVRQAKIVAAKRGTSISGLVARELELLVARDARYEEARRRALELLAESWPAAAGDLAAGRPRRGRPASRGDPRTSSRAGSSAV